MTAPLVDLTVHHRPRGAADRVAYGFVKALRFFADTFFAKRYGHRAVVLETVAAVPGMVGATLNHLKCLRRMEDDRGWIKTLMDEAENGVRVLGVAPGSVETPMLRWAINQDPNPKALDEEIDAMHPIGRRGQPREIGEVIAFLLSDKASFMTGETVRVDDPQLTVRGVRVKSQPLRAVWTRSGQLPASARLLQSPSPAVLFRNVPLARALRRLGEQGIPSVLLEGGGRLLGEAFDRGLVDEVCLYLAPMISGGLIPTIAGRGVGSNGDGIALEGVNYRRLGDDVCLTGRVVRN